MTKAQIREYAAKIGKRGGLARQAAMNPAQRSERGKALAAIRWARVRAQKSKG